MSSLRENKENASNIRKKRIIITVISVITLSILMLSILYFQIENRQTQNNQDLRIEHSPIFIYGNDNFTFENGVCNGSGTREDPFIIEQWNISDKYGSTTCVYLFNTTAHVIIRNIYASEGPWGTIILLNVSNCLIQNSTIRADYNMAGLRLINCQNIAVVSCQFLGANGISIDNARNILIEHNLIPCGGQLLIGSLYAFIFSDVDGLIIMSNDFTGSGMNRLYDCSNVILINNTLGKYGINYDGCTNVIEIDNLL